MQSPQHHHKKVDKTSIFVVLIKQTTIQNYKIPYKIPKIK